MKESSNNHYDILKYESKTGAQRMITTKKIIKLMNIPNHKHNP